MKEIKNKQYYKELNKYKILNNIYTELQSKSYSVNEANRFIFKCGVLETNYQSLKLKVPMRRLKECLREAKREESILKWQYKKQ